MTPAASTYSSSKLVDGPLEGGPNVTVPSSTEQFFLLNGVQEGTSKYNRIGDRIKMKSIQIMGKWIPRSAGSTPTVVTRVYGRLAIVYDRYPKGTFPTANEIFQCYSEAGTPVMGTYPWSAPNPVYSDRFIIVRDCKFNFTTNDSLSTNTMALYMMNNNTVEGNDCSLFKKLNGLETQFLSTANPITVANIGTGTLLFMVWSNTASDSAPGSFEWTWRMRFYDY